MMTVFAWIGAAVSLLAAFGFAAGCVAWACESWAAWARDRRADKRHLMLAEVGEDLQREACWLSESLSAAAAVEAVGECLLESPDRVRGDRLRAVWRRRVALRAGGSVGRVANN